MAVNISTDTNTVKVTSTSTNNVKIVDNGNNTSVTVSQPTTGVIKVVTAGPQGPPGISVNTGSFTNTDSFNAFTSSYNTGSFTGSFTGDGSGLYDIPASGIIGLNLSQISSGSVSATISPGNGLQSNVGIIAPSFTGSLFGTASFVDVSALLGFTPENVANKNTSTALGTSDSLYPTQNAVKTYVDTGLSAKQNSLGFTPENVANKSTTTSLGTSDSLYPTQNAVKTYVDGKKSNLILYGSYGTINSVAGTWYTWNASQAMLSGATSAYGTSTEPTILANPPFNHGIYDSNQIYLRGAKRLVRAWFSYRQTTGTQSQMQFYIVSNGLIGNDSWYNTTNRVVLANHLSVTQNNIFVEIPINTNDLSATDGNSIYFFYRKVTGTGTTINGVKLYLEFEMI
jgi:hypothetical protein